MGNYNPSAAFVSWIQEDACSPDRSSLARQTLTTLLHSHRGTVVPVAAEPSVEMDETRVQGGRVSSLLLVDREAGVRGR
jgi:hypothetical protein